MPDYPDRPPPPKPHNLIVRVTPKELADYNQCAKDENLKLSEWVRTALRAAVRSQRRRQSRERSS